MVNVIILVVQSTRPVLQGAQHSQTGFGGRANGSLQQFSSKVQANRRKGVILEWIWALEGANSGLGRGEVPVVTLRPSWASLMVLELGHNLLNPSCPFIPPLIFPIPQSEDFQSRAEMLKHI